MQWNAHSCRTRRVKNAGAFLNCIQALAKICAQWPVLLIKRKNTLSNIAVIGAGAAGMMSAILIAEQGHTVTVFEQNERIGKKLYITGKGRCNFTNACSRDTFLSSVISNPRFLYSAYDTMDSEAVIDFFESHGMKTKIERGNRAFPASDKSADVIDTLRDAMRRQGVKVRLRSRVTGILTDEGRVTGLAAVNLDDGVEK